VPWQVVTGHLEFWGLVSTGGLEALPMKTTALVVDEESILYDFAYNADISWLDTKSVKARPRPPDSALIGAKDYPVPNLERIF
jgi:hypothetical protein